MVSSGWLARRATSTSCLVGRSSRPSAEPTTQNDRRYVPAPAYRIKISLLMSAAFQPSELPRLNCRLGCLHNELLGSGNLSNGQQRYSNGSRKLFTYCELQVPLLERANTFLHQRECSFRTLLGENLEFFS